MPGRADPDRAAVLQDWEETFGSSPPKYLTTDTLLATQSRTLPPSERSKQRMIVPDTGWFVIRPSPEKAFSFSSFDYRRSTGQVAEFAEESHRFILLFAGHLVSF